jgi:dihydroorotase
MAPNLVAKTFRPGFDAPSMRSEFELDTEEDDVDIVVGELVETVEATVERDRQIQRLNAEVADWEPPPFCAPDIPVFTHQEALAAVFKAEQELLAAVEIAKAASEKVKRARAAAACFGGSVI